MATMTNMTNITNMANMTNITNMANMTNITDMSCVMSMTDMQNVENVVRALATFNTVFTIVPVVLHSIGIHLLRNVSSLCPIETLYLIHMSIAELVFCFWDAVLIVSHAFAPDSDFYSYNQFLSHGNGFAWCFILIALTIDRFFRVFLNIKYDVYITKRKSEVILVLCHLIGFSIILLLLVLPVSFKAKQELVNIYLTTGIGALVFFVFFYVYLYILGKIKAVQRRNSLQNPIARNRKSHILPFLIVLFFFLFFMIPTAVAWTIKMYIRNIGCFDGLIYQIESTFYIIGLIMDAFLYIFLHKSLKQKFIRMINNGLVANNKTNIYMENCQSKARTARRDTSYHNSIHSQ